MPLALPALAGSRDSSVVASASRVQSDAFPFIENRGQWPIEARFVGRLPNMLVRAEQNALCLQLFEGAGDASHGVLVRLVFEGMTAGCVLEAEDEMAGRFNYFIGNDPACWQTNVRACSRIWYRNLYRGIDLCLHEEGGSFKFDLVVAPGADVSQVAVRCEGARALCIDGDGGLRIETGLGDLRQPPGPSFELLASGEARTISSRYRLIGENSFGFELQDRDLNLPLVIDPDLSWSTYLGGSNNDYAVAVAVNPAGEVYVTGWTESHDFPRTPGAYVVAGLQPEIVFVSKLDATGQNLIYSSFFGGVEKPSQPTAIAVDSSGRATVVGWTQAATFPTTAGAFDEVHTSVFSGGFVSRLSEGGDQLLYSTFIEGPPGGTEAWAVAVTPSGAAIVGGTTTALNFPTTPGAFSTQLQAVGNAFISRVDPTGSFLEWSTLFGGSGSTNSWITALAIDEDEQITVVGVTNSPNYPTTPGAFMTSFPGSAIAQRNVFVTRLDAQASTLIWSTFLGGKKDELAGCVTLNSQGGVVVGGLTESSDFPTTPGALQLRHDQIGDIVNDDDAFVSHLSPDGSSLIASTYIGSTYNEFVAGVGVDVSGVVTLAGWSSQGFPVTPGAYDVVGNLTDIFVARLDPAFSKLYYGTFLGASGFEEGTALALGPQGRVTVVGASTGSYPATEGAFDTTYNGGYDAVVTTLELVLEGIRLFGESTPACNGPLFANATHRPVGGEPRFGLYCSGAPALADGWLFTGMASLNATTYNGAQIWLDSTQELQRVPVKTNATGFVEVSVPLTALAPGAKFACQFVFDNTQTCGGESTASASNAVQVDVQ